MFENSISSEEPRQRPVKKDAHTDEVAKQHNLYTDDKSTMWGKERVYYADYKQKSVVMRAQENRITTKLDDHQTVSAMLDLAESRGWDRISLKGSDSFRREAWVQAQARGIETSGYKPKDTDMQEAARRQVDTNPEAPAAKKATGAPPAARPKNKSTQGVKQQRAQEKAVWGTVEVSGKQARSADAQRQSTVPVASEAA